MSRRSPWPGVRRKRAKGRDYWYFTRTKPWTRLPSPFEDADAFSRKLAHLQRITIDLEQKRATGTFGALVKAYRQSRRFRDGLSSNTRVAYDRYISRLLVAYADAPLVEMTPHDIRVRVLDANEDTPAAADMMLTVLRTLYAYAKDRHPNIPNWVEGLKYYGNQTEREPWPEDLLEAALTSEDELFRNAVTLALYTGQRPGDVCAMTWGSIAGDAIRVRQQKTKVQLEIPMHPDLVSMIANLQRASDHVHLLSNRRGAPLTAAVFLKWCQAFSRGYGINRTPHGLRKNAVIELFHAGCSTAEVASISGHRSLAMLEHYGKQRSQSKIARPAMAKWGAARNENGKTLPVKENRQGKILK